MVPAWIFLVVVLWALGVTIFLFVRNPLPFPDRGHRCFAVPNEETARVVVGILAQFGNLPERFTFSPGPTHQALLWDNTTVVIWHDKTAEERGFPSNGISVVTSNPTWAADRAAAILRKRGYSAKIVKDHMPEVGGKLVVLASDAFDGWVLVFRKHILAMGQPPKKRKLT